MMQRVLAGSSGWKRLLQKQPSLSSRVGSAFPTRTLTALTQPIDADYLKDIQADKGASDARKNTKQPDSTETSTWTPPKDPWNLEDVMDSSIGYDELPDWDSTFVSRISAERIQIHPNKIPTLTELASLPLPYPDPNQDSNKLYALQRKRQHYKYIYQQVQRLAESRIQAIRALENWEEKQDAVDLLFEDIEAQLKEREEILGKHPSFGQWVERALEEYLQSVQKEPSASSKEELDDSSAVPLFMDCYPSDGSHDDNTIVPTILRPLQPHSRNMTVGSMVEEWELAAHKKTKRILLRQSTRHIAKALQDGVQRIYVHGAQGAGKSAALASIVAAARTSGAIVLYLPNGDDLHKNGFYLEANAKRPGVFDLPILSKNACDDMLATHGDILETIMISKDILASIFTEEQLVQIDLKDDVNASDLLKHGVSKLSHAPMAYSAVVEALMTQTQVDFIMVLDEFNCFFEKSHYYHGDYEDAKIPVPYEQISLFQPAFETMSLVGREMTPLEERKTPRPIQRGAVIVATTESHAIARTITEALTADAKSQQDEMNDIKLVAVPRFSALEVDHMLANYEAVGVGKLRMDRGETIMNEQEVARLRMISGSVAQKLLDACII